MNRRHHCSKRAGRLLLYTVIITFLSAPGIAFGDVVEMLSGRRIEGKVVRQTGEHVVLRVEMGGGAAEMKLPVAKVHAVTIGRNRKVLNEATGETTKPAAKAGGRDDSGRVTRTRAQIQALITKAGNTPPDWWDDVPLEYPDTLDLSWPARPSGPWNARRNVGQYMWSTINENPSKWKSGTRFMHHMLTVQKSRPDGLNRVIGSLAHCYQDLLQDWPRATFWRRKDVLRNGGRVGSIVRLAECYWKLGNKSMAAGELRKVSRYVSPGIIKLWSDMGELSKALSTASTLARLGAPHDAYMAAADACRLHGQHKQALKYYQKVINTPARGQMAERQRKTQARARDSIEAVRVFDALDLAKIADGSYSGTSMAFTGPLEVRVTVAGSRIESVKVTLCKDKQFFGALTETPRQIVEKQGVKGVDAVTGATITAQAVINAAAKALSGAMK